ncbi:MAG: CpaF family protein [Mogibacterium sp.]|nr:CpaF family protein [Mogibacterium sp.]
MMKEIIQKYRGIIRSETRRIRWLLTELEQEPQGQELLQLVEEQFFRSDSLREVEILDTGKVIDAIYRRIRSKYGILSPLLLDDAVNEIMVNGPDAIYIEKHRTLQEVDDAFLSEEELEGVIRMFASDVHREINEANPIVDARMANGYRVNGVLRNVALNGPALTIRKFQEEELTMEDLIRFGSLSRECAEDLEALVRCGYNLFISGGTSSGKTTMLNALAAYIGEEERVIIIEDSAELQIRHVRNKIHLECRSANSIGKGAVTMEMLIRTSLRMRPDRIIVGEVRGREVVDLIQANNTGHDGSFSTGHGNSIRGMLYRLETMYMMDAQIPMVSIRSQIANALDVFIHLRRDSEGARRVVEIAEMEGCDGMEYRLNYLYTQGENGELVRTGNPLIHWEKLIRGRQNDKLKGSGEA